MENSILLQNVSLNSLTQLFNECLEKRFEKFREELNHQNDKDDLMTREQVLDFLQINSSTLWHWQNKNKIIVYKFANKNYYKRSEILENLTALKK
jgi:hypothetical protein